MTRTVRPCMLHVEGQMRKVMTVIKMRGSDHSKDLRLYEVTADGLVVGETLYDYRGIVTGVARRHLSDESEDAGERAKPADPLLQPE